MAICIETVPSETAWATRAPEQILRAERAGQQRGGDPLAGFHWVLAAYLYTLAGIRRPAPTTGTVTAARIPRGAAR